jgi:uncharacterized protein YbjT (DUF2867 family)
MNRKIIAVVGATGAQGGGLVRSILADRDGEFAVRAITRDPSSPRAREMAAAGAEVVAADLADPGSVARAFDGAWGAYCVTFFWAHMSPDRERAEAQAMADAAQQARLQHVIWSTLEDSRRYVPLDDPRMPTLMGRYKVPHFDVKGEADAYFRASGVPTTFMLTSFYWDNLIHFGMAPRSGPDGKLHFALPMGTRPLPGIAAEDIGRCAHGIFRRGSELAGRTVGVAGEHLTGAEMAARLSHALGREVVHDHVPFEVYRSLGFPGADDLGNMFQFNHDFAAEFGAARSVGFSRSVNPALQDFERWLAAHAREIPVA